MGRETPHSWRRLSPRCRPFTLNLSLNLQGDFYRVCLRIGRVVAVTERVCTSAWGHTPQSGALCLPDSFLFPVLGPGSLSRCHFIEHLLGAQQ